MQGSASARSGRRCRVVVGARVLCAWAAWVSVGGWSLALGAGFQPSETVFPDTTRAWLSIPNPRGLHERFDRSNYGQLVAAVLAPTAAERGDRVATMGGLAVAVGGLTAVTAALRLAGATRETALAVAVVVAAGVALAVGTHIIPLLAHGGFY